MTYESPESFNGISVKCSSYDQFGQELGPFSVIGVRDTARLKDRVTVIQSDIKNRQVAEKWMDVYLEKYVIETYFDGHATFKPVDGTR